ncbi:MAG: TolC family protein, partial [Pseudomonadota bacterium]|nr:TolC family protein [Pseudomonadota bacterium]
MSERPYTRQPAAPARRLLPALLPLLLAACAGAPAYHTPEAQPALPAAFAGARTADPVAGLAHFWHGFGDAALDELVQSALAANGDLALAEARLREARSNLDVAAVDHLPSFDVSADATRAIEQSYLLPGTTRSQRTYTGIDAGFVANWELDLFGRASSGREAASARAAAGAAGVDAARISVVAEVARNYLVLRGTQERQDVTRRALDNQRASLAIVQARFDAGRATDLDQQRALALTETTQAQLPALAALADQTILRLATLTATSPPLLLERLRAPAPLPGLPVVDLGALPA